MFLEMVCNSPELIADAFAYVLSEWTQDQLQMYSLVS